VNWTLLIFVVSGIALANALVHVVSASVISKFFEREPNFQVPKHEPNPLAEVVSFPTENNMILKGSLLLQKDRKAQGVVLFCPEYGGSHWLATKYLQALHEEGFHILGFDFRNQGESDFIENYTPLHWLTTYEVQDTKAAVDYIRSRSELKDLPLGIFGVSRGGAAALAVGANDSQVRCVVTEGAFCTEMLSVLFTLRWATLYMPGWMIRCVPLWHIRISLKLSRMLTQSKNHCRYVVLRNNLAGLKKTDVLLIAGEGDTYIPLSIHKEMKTRVNSDRCSLWTVPKAKHNLARDADPQKYDENVLKFFQTALGTPNLMIETETVRHFCL